MRIKLLILLLIASFAVKAQTQALNNDSTKIGKNATSSTLLNGRVWMKGLTAGLSTDSVLVLRFGKLFKVPRSQFALPGSYILADPATPQITNINIDGNINFTSGTVGSATSGYLNLYSGGNGVTGYSGLSFEALGNPTKVELRWQPQDFGRGLHIYDPNNPNNTNTGNNDWFRIVTTDDLVNLSPASITLGLPTTATGTNYSLVRDSITGLIKQQKITSGSGGGAVSSVFGRTGAISPLSADYAAFYYPLGSNPAGYLTSFTESDPTVPSYAKSLTAFSIIKTSTDALYEPIFSKNTAFNKNFGATSGTVAEGNDSRIVNALSISTASSTYQTLSNLSTDLTPSSTKYPNVNAVNTGLLGKQNLHTTIIGWGDSMTFGTGSTAGNDYLSDLSKVSGFTTLNQGVAGETSTQIRTRFFSYYTANPLAKSNPVIIWVGRNNYTDTTTIKADIAAMVSVLPHSNYLIVGVTNSNPGEPLGNSGYTTIVALNNSLSNIYKNRFVDIRKILVNSYNPGIPQDVSDYANDLPPSSLLSDNIHLNDAGYLVVKNAIAYRMNFLLNESISYSDALLSGYVRGGDITLSRPKGAGVEIFRIGGVGYLQSYNGTTNLPEELRVQDFANANVNIAPQGGSVSVGGNSTLGVFKLPYLQTAILKTSSDGTVQNAVASIDYLSPAATTLPSSFVNSSLANAAGGTFGTNAFNSTAYLPLAGGTLTGNLSGTTATFSGIVNIGSLTNARIRQGSISATEAFLQSFDGSVNQKLSLFATETNFQSQISGNKFQTGSNGVDSLLVHDSSTGKFKLISPSYYSTTGGGGGGSGTVTSFGKVDNYGITSSVTNPTSTPVHTVGVDTANIVSKPYLSSLNSTVLHKSGTETATGQKTLSTGLTTPFIDNSGGYAQSSSLRLTGSSYTTPSDGNIRIENGGSNKIGFANDVSAIDFQLPTNSSRKTLTVRDISGTVALLSDITGGSGTVTSFSKTDGFGITSSVSNPTTTPNHTVAVDTTVVRSVANSRSLAQTQTALNLKANLAGGNSFSGLQAITGQMSLSQFLPGTVGTDSIVVHDNTSDKFKLIDGTFNISSRFSGLGTSGSPFELATVTVPFGGTGVTTLTGLVKGNGTSAFSAATAGTDYVAPSTTVAGFALSGNVTLANLTATNATLTFSGTYTGATARTIGLNLGNANTWTAPQSGTTPAVTDNTTKFATTAYVKSQILTATATLDFPSTAMNQNSVLTVTVTGAAVGDAALVNWPSTIAPPTTWNGTMNAYVSATNTVTVVFMNNDPLAVHDLASASFTVKVFK